MNLRLVELILRTRQTTEHLPFSPTVTFIHGPIGRGKSTVARLIDYCLGGDLERTVAIRQEFVAAELLATIGVHECRLERGADEASSVRVAWSGPDGQVESVNAPLVAGDAPILGEEVFNLSDLLFYLASIVPIKVRRSRDPDSPLVRLSFRDLWWYCYLDQTHLDSSFFRLEDAFRGRKSQDAMRFFTGMYSEQLNSLERELFRAIDAQRGKREAVQKIREFMIQFGWATDVDLAAQIETANAALREAEAVKRELDSRRQQQTHPTDALRERLREIGRSIDATRVAIGESEEGLREQVALRGELITARLKAERTSQAAQVLQGVEYERCPQCGTDIRTRPHRHDQCGLCLSDQSQGPTFTAEQLELIRRDFNERIDQIADSIERKRREITRMRKQLDSMSEEKRQLDRQLEDELARYDSAFVETIRGTEREIATYAERVRSLRQMQRMPAALTSLETEAAALQATIDDLRSQIEAERFRLREADENVGLIAHAFKSILLRIGFPGISERDEVVLDVRNWQPRVVHGDHDWSFWDAGSGGKKTLFNVCYALAVHQVALVKSLPVPNVLVIDSPTKNISEDEDPELVRNLYSEIYRLARGDDDSFGRVQFVLIDSDLVEPEPPIEGFSHRRMAGEPDAPSLIPYYNGP